MKALILNSGLGSRMGVLTSEHPKCMTEISNKETILSRQLRQISDAGIEEVVITTGAFDAVLVSYCQSLELPLHFTFVKNPIFRETNYIYSIYCAREYLDDDILLLHGDLVFEDSVLESILLSASSCMAISTTLPLPEKDFKAVIRNDAIIKIGVEFFNEAAAAQPLYKLFKKDWAKWLAQMIVFCESGKVKCYAENAYNEMADAALTHPLRKEIDKIEEQMADAALTHPLRKEIDKIEEQMADAALIHPLDIKNSLCKEIDNAEDLAVVVQHLREIESRTVYMCFSTDILHSGHISIIKKAGRLGKLIIGVLSDEAIASYKRFPLLPASERKIMFGQIAGVYKVVEQATLSYKENLEKYRPTYVVHGDDWKDGIQKPIRDEVVSVLAEYGGRLMEYPYAEDEKYRELEKRACADLSSPDMRRGRLKKLLAMKGIVTALEAHSGITGLIVEKTAIYKDGITNQFDAMWVSSLCDSTAKGKPDIELVDMTSRFRTLDDIMDVTTKPIIFDGDTGGLTEHFVYTVRTLERMGISMIIIEDKTGLKRNSLFGTEVEQMQDTIENFAAKIQAGKRAQKTRDFMICARIESLILERGMEDALMRAASYVKAGADAIMIHSRKKEPAEIFEFIENFRSKDSVTPIVVVPTSFSMVREEEFRQRGANLVIYANHLTRSAFPAMQNAAKMILENRRAKECDDICMSIKDIIRLIPEDN